MASPVSKKFFPLNAFIKRETQYEPLTSGDNNIESESGSDTLLLLSKRGFNSVSFFSWLVIIANLVIFVFSCSALFHTYKRGEKIHINENLKTLSLYCGCPCNHVVRKQAIYKVLSSPPQRHRNPPHNSHEPSTIRRWRLHNLPRPPKSRIDAAWSRLSPEHIWSVSHSDILKMRKDPEVVAKLPPEYGENAYVGKALAFHHIHCLNSIRQALHKDYYYPDGDPYPLFNLHTSHCIQVLLEHLMCEPDPGIYLFRWMDKYPMPIADTNIWSRCWDFESFFGTVSEHGHFEYLELDLVKPDYGKFVPAPTFIVRRLRMRLR